MRISREKVRHGQNITQQWVVWVEWAEWTSLQVVLTGCPMYRAFSRLSGSLLFFFLLFSSQVNGVPGNDSVMELCGELASLLFCLFTLLNCLSNIGPILVISYRSWIFAKISRARRVGKKDHRGSNPHNFLVLQRELVTTTPHVLLFKNQWKKYSGKMIQVNNQIYLLKFL